MIFMFFFEISKEEKSKTIYTRTRTRTVLVSALNSEHGYEETFLIFIIFLEFLETTFFFLLASSEK